MIKKIKRIFINFLQWKSRHRVFSWPAYGKWVETMHQDKSQFVPFTSNPYVRKEGDVKIFAYYLTQFHAIPENDDAHGKGFTEWNNVASSVPHFVGHEQPKLPYDLGFYNLLMPGVMERQVEIAQAYGVYGFCFYYYWFAGKRVLEKPLEYFLKNKDIDFHYHLCWANENWSKLWDGGNSQIILKQDFEKDNAELFFTDILPYFQDPRYEKIDNKPILMIYRPSLFPKNRFVEFVNTLQRLAKENGFDGVYIAYSNHTEIDGTPDEWKIDAKVEFPPHGILVRATKYLNRLIPSTNFTVHNMDEFIQKKKYLYQVKHKTFKCCFPGWDNIPRKAWSGGRCYQVSDEGFKIWLYDIIKWTQENNTDKEQYVYINAWNEWAEGAILEPTIRHGYKYLSFIKDVLIKSRRL